MLPRRFVMLAVVLLCAPMLLRAQAARLSPDAPKDRPKHVTSDSALTRLYAAMQPYIDRARATYPAARERYLRGLPPGQLFFVTTRIHDAAGHEEQVFVAVDSIVPPRIFGRIASEINLVRGYRPGQRFALTEDALIDWLIARPDGTEEGNIVGKFLDTYRP